MKEFILSIIAVLALGLMTGCCIGAIVTAHSFSSKIASYEKLLDVIDEDNPGYFDNILCETDEWSNLYP